MKTLALFMSLYIPAIVFSQQEFPAVYSLTSQFERIEIVRMSSGTDMLESLNQVIAEKNIKNAVILAGIGSVTDYHFHVVSDRNLPPANQFTRASVAKDLVSVQGYVLNGRVHAHIALSDENSVIGGHLESGTKALTFFILTLGLLPDDIDIETFDSYKKP
jgi:predicted DNA-binding protein with PD1-like motif